MRTFAGVSPGFLIIGILFTVGHAFFQLRQARGRGPPAVARVSLLEIGGPLPRIDLRAVGSSEISDGEALASSGSSCHLVVAFDPTCPYSLRAAHREGRTPHHPKLAVSWVTDRLGGATDDFVTSTRPSVRIFYAAGALDSLRVFGVPAGILVGADGRIIKVWPYIGNESHGDLLVQCTAHQESATEQPE